MMPNGSSAGKEPTKLNHSSLTKSRYSTLLFFPTDTRGDRISLLQEITKYRRVPSNKTVDQTERMTPPTASILDDVDKKLEVLITDIRACTTVETHGACIVSPHQL
jgi:hypothetical protein